MQEQKYPIMKKDGHWKIVKNSAGEPLLEKNVYDNETGKVMSTQSEKIDVAKIKSDLAELQEREKALKIILADIEGTASLKPKKTQTKTI